MSTASPQPDPAFADTLEEVVGYLNFSSGASDSKFLANINRLFARIEHPDAPDQQCTLGTLRHWLTATIDQLAARETAFADVSQARAALSLTCDELLPAYRHFHRDLLWHQQDCQLWRPFFMGRAVQTVLTQGGPWDQTDRIVTGALQQLNDYIGYRPVAALENDERMEPYPNEWVRPIPLYLADVGIAHGPYNVLIERTLQILQDTDSDLLREAWFDPEMITELALDPRAYDFDHPAGKRPNYQFGQWDPHTIDNRGFYRRFVLQQIALDSLLARVDDLAGDGRRTQHELMFEAAAVLAGTMLMASGTSGNGADCHSSDVTLGTLLPHIADYRDRFYDQLLEQVDGDHAVRLRAEADRTRQPFGGARQHLNHQLARRRAKQLQHVHLAQLFARMGYPDAALRQARTVRVASARIMSQIYCRLTAGHLAIDAGDLPRVAEYVPEIEDLLRRGIRCGALVDPWNIVGFGGNFSLFPALENTVRDFRVDDLLELVEQSLDLASRAWTEAAAVDDSAHEKVFSASVRRLAAWWDQYATSTVSGVKRLVGKEIEVSTDLVAGALNAWHKAGAAAGDVKFWRLFVDEFDSPKAFQLVVEALLDQGDLVASMALMMQWVSQAERTPLEDGDASFHLLVMRWLRAVESFEHESGEDQWPLVEKFFNHLEASAESYWHVPTLELGSDADDDSWDPDSDEFESGLVDEDDELDNLFSAAYEDVTYRDSTDDGFDSDLADDRFTQTDYEMEEEAARLEQRLGFLATVARLWKHAAIAWNADSNGRTARREPLDAWHQQATARYAQLVMLLETVHRHRVPPPSGSHESMVEFDRRRLLKDSILEQIITTCVEMSDAGRLLRASSGGPASGASAASPIRRTVELLRAVLAGDADAVRRHWESFTRSLASQELLYIPLAKGGSPRRIVKARALGQLIHDLLGWLPRLGLVRETCHLLDVAQQMEAKHQVGQGAVTEYDRLFTCGYQAIVRCLVASADMWEDGCQTRTFEAGTEQTGFGDCVRASDAMLVEALQDLTESQLRRWLTHSKTLRLSVVEKLAEQDDWESFVAFIKRYGSDLFTQMFMNLGNLRAILHQRAAVWLSNLEQDGEEEEILLIAELGEKISRSEAAKMLSIALEAIVENYREYRDYNTTTTQSDHGEMLYTLVDFLRVKAAYDRVAWNLRPVVMAHEILVRQNRPAAAELWQRLLTERTADVADVHLTKFADLCDKYGMQLPSIADRLGERFTRPLAIDRVRALVEPAIEAADPESDAFAALECEIESLAAEPTGAGLDVPDWLAALEDEVTTVRTTRRHRQPASDLLRRIGQTPVPWHDLQEQLADDAG